MLSLKANESMVAILSQATALAEICDSSGKVIGFYAPIAIKTSAVPITPGTGDWEAAARAAQELRETGYDFEAWREQRAYDLEHAKDRQP